MKLHSHVINTSICFEINQPDVAIQHLQMVFDIEGDDTQAETLCHTVYCRDLEERWPEAHDAPDLITCDSLIRRKIPFHTTTCDQLMVVDQFLAFAKRLGVPDDQILADIIDPRIQSRN